MDQPSQSKSLRARTRQTLRLPEQQTMLFLVVIDPVSSRVRLMLLLLVLALAGCGGAGKEHLQRTTTSAASEPNAVPSVVATAAARTAKIHTVRFHADVFGLYSDKEITVDGVADISAQQADATVGSDTRVIVNGGTVYASGPDFEPLLKGNEEWVKADLRGLSNPMLANYAALVRLAAGGKAVQLLRSVRYVKKVGTASASMAGVDTIQYEGTVDPAEAVPTLAQVFGSFVSRTVPVPVQVWIDRKGLVRQVQVASAQFDLTLRFSDFSARLRVQLPAADEVAELSR